MVSSPVTRAWKLTEANIQEGDAEVRLAPWRQLFNFQVVKEFVQRGGEQLWGGGLRSLHPEAAEQMVKSVPRLIDDFDGGEKDIRPLTI